MSDNVLLHLGRRTPFRPNQNRDIKPALQTAIAEAREQIAAIKATNAHRAGTNTVEN